MSGTWVQPDNNIRVKFVIDADQVPLAPYNDTLYRTATDYCGSLVGEEAAASNTCIFEMRTAID